MTKVHVTYRGPSHALTLANDGKTYRRGESFDVDDGLVALLVKAGHRFEIDEPATSKRAKPATSTHENGGASDEP